MNVLNFLDVQVICVSTPLSFKQQSISHFVFAQLGLYSRPEYCVGDVVLLQSHTLSICLLMKMLILITSSRYCLISALYNYCLSPSPIHAFLKGEILSLQAIYIPLHTSLWVLCPPRHMLHDSSDHLGQAYVLQSHQGLCPTDHKGSCKLLSSGGIHTLPK